MIEYNYNIVQSKQEEVSNNISSFWPMQREQVFRSDFSAHQLSRVILSEISSQLFSIDISIIPSIVVEIEDLGIRVDVPPTELINFLKSRDISEDHFRNWLKKLADILKGTGIEHIYISLKQIRDPEIRGWDDLILEILVDTDVRRIMELWDSLSDIISEPVGKKIYITIKPA